MTNKDKLTNRPTSFFTPGEVERIVRPHIAPKETAFRVQPKPRKKVEVASRCLNWVVEKDGVETKIFNLRKFADDNDINYLLLWQAYNRKHRHEGYAVWRA